MKNVLMGLWALVVAGCLVCLTFQAQPQPMQPAATNSAEVILDKSLEIPPDVKLLNIECGSPCMIYWDPMAQQYVAAFANGGVVYFTMPQASE